MDPRAETLIHGYLDGLLDEDEQLALARWIEADPENARRFALAMLLHDRLGDQFRAVETEEGASECEPIRFEPPSRTRRAAVFVVAAGVLAAGLAVVQLATRSRLDAAEVQLDRLIAAARSAGDRTYRISVLDPESSGASDPSQPSMQGALLHVRGQGEYVLARRVGARSFLTGSNGSEGWSIPAEGPVRVSADPRRFRGALPGEQQDLPFVELSTALTRLREAYRLELSDERESPTRQLRARKRSASHRGPRGVVIDFDTVSGVIRRMRLEGLPQARGGPRGLTLELISENDLGPDFFEHETHHGSDRRVARGD